MENRNNIIAYVTGRSGGHIIPCLTLAKKEPHARILFFSTNTALDHKLLAGNEILAAHIPLTLENIPYKKPWRLPIFAWQLFKSFCKSIWHLHCYKPKKIVSTGGYIAIPVCIAAQLLGIPIELYELNVHPGKAIKSLSPLASTIFVCFAETEKFLKRPCTPTDYPISFSKQHKISQHKALQKLRLPTDKKTIFILGGSQGSIGLNTIIKEWLKTHLHLHNQINIIHQTGTIDTTDWKSFYKTHKINATVFSYNHDLSTFYCAADLVICRAGAGTLFELLFFEKQSIVIPLTAHTTSHQVANARAMTQIHPHLFFISEQNDSKKITATITEKLAFASNKTGQKHKKSLEYS